ncbi:MAG TPA: hypothetical protein VKG92_00140 [Flavobacteriales bacterium]|nr:hypothetical protein [Flavobacteriales bacterium]
MASVDAFIDKQPEAVAADRRTLIKLMKKATGEEPRMCRSSGSAMSTWNCWKN